MNFSLTLALHTLHCQTTSRKPFKCSPLLYHETDAYHNAELNDYSVLDNDVHSTGWWLLEPSRRRIIFYLSHPFRT